MTCEQIRLSLGALALGSLDDAEAIVVREHLDGCEECRREHDELRRLPRLLGMVTLDAFDPVPEPSPEQETLLLERIATERQRVRRQRLFRTIGGGFAVAAAAAALGMTFGGAPIADGEPADMTLHATDRTTGVEAEVALNQVGWGTKIALELSGVDAGETCRLVATSSDGDEVAGTWRVPADVDDYITIPGAIGVDLENIESFDVISSDGATLVHIPYDHSAQAAAHP